MLPSLLFPQFKTLVPYIQLLTIVVIGLWKPYTKTSVGAALSCIMFVEDSQCGCLMWDENTWNICNQDQKYDNENTRTITELIK